MVVHLILGDFAQEQEIDIEVPTLFPTADRIIAIGDVHGDVDALSGCLKVCSFLCAC